MSAGVRNRHRVAVKGGRDAGQSTSAGHTVGFTSNCHWPRIGRSRAPAFVAGAESACRCRGETYRRIAGHGLRTGHRLDGRSREAHRGDMPIAREAPLRPDLGGNLRRLARRTGIAVHRLRRDCVIEQLLSRLLEAAPDRWVRFDDWRLEYRVDGPATADEASGGVSEPTRAAVNAALRQVTEHQGLQPIQFAVHARDRAPQAAQGPALAYRVEAFDRDGEIGEVDLIAGFAFPPPEEIEWLPGLGESTAQDDLPRLIPTRSRLAQLADRLGAYTGRTSRFPACADLLTIARYAPQVECTADRMHRAMDRVWPWNSTPSWPLAIPAPPPWWTDDYRRGAAELGLEPALAAGHAWAAALLDPILSGTVPSRATWKATELRWIRRAAPAVSPSSGPGRPQVPLAPADAIGAGADAPSRSQPWRASRGLSAGRQISPNGSASNSASAVAATYTLGRWAQYTSWST